MSLSILMFCPTFRPAIGGAERQAEKLAIALAALGVRMTILTPLVAASTPRSESIEGGVQIHRFPLFNLSERWPGVRGIGPINLLSMRHQTINAVRRFAVGNDLMHGSLASPLTVFAMQAARKLNLPTLCKVAMAGPRNDLREISSVGLGGASMARSIVLGLDRWVATTSAVKESLVEFGVTESRIVNIPNGVESVPVGRSRENPGRARRFLYLGRLSTNIERDVPSLIRAFDELADEIPDAELAIVGDGDLLAPTADLVASMRHKERILLPGVQEPNPWLEWADCFVLPSRREGLSNALLEAMSHGLACVANDIGPNREVLSHGAAGILVPVGDRSALHQAIKRMATDPAHFKQMAAAAGARMKAEYSIESVARRYLSLYQNLLEARSESRRGMTLGMGA